MIDGHRAAGILPITPEMANSYRLGRRLRVEDADASKGQPQGSRHVVAEPFDVTVGGIARLFNRWEPVSGDQTYRRARYRGAPG